MPLGLAWVFQSLDTLMGPGGGLTHTTLIFQLLHGASTALTVDPEGLFLSTTWMVVKKTASLWRAASAHLADESAHDVLPTDSGEA